MNKNKLNMFVDWMEEDDAEKETGGTGEDERNDEREAGEVSLLGLI